MELVILKKNKKEFIDLLVYKNPISIDQKSNYKDP